MCVARGRVRTWLFEEAGLTDELLPADGFTAAALPLDCVAGLVFFGVKPVECSLISFSSSSSSSSSATARTARPESHGF